MKYSEEKQQGQALPFAFACSVRAISRLIRETESIQMLRPFFAFLAGMGQKTKPFFLSLALHEIGVDAP